jgi:hypothetical protein
LFRRATSKRERPRDFDAARVKAPIQTWIDIDPWTSKGKSAKEVIGRGLVEVVSCFRDPGQERGQSIFYFNGETNLTHIHTPHLRHSQSATYPMNLRVG